MRVYLVELSYSIDEPTQILGIYSQVDWAQEKCASHEQAPLVWSERNTSPVADPPDPSWSAWGRDGGHYTIVGFEVDDD